VAVPVSAPTSVVPNDPPPNIKLYSTVDNSGSLTPIGENSSFWMNLSDVQRLWFSFFKYILVRLGKRLCLSSWCFRGSSSLMSAPEDNSMVCCIKFSADGEYGYLIIGCIAVNFHWTFQVIGGWVLDHIRFWQSHSMHLDMQNGSKKHGSKKLPTNETADSGVTKVSLLPKGLLLVFVPDPHVL